jgi:putative transposase
VGWLYLAVVIDLFPRRVVDWSMSNMITTDLVIKALLKDILRRRPKSKAIVHSD